MPLSNSQYDEIFRKYDEKQLASQHQLERRTKDVYARIPALKEIDDAIATCSVEQARRLLDGDEAALATLREKLSDYRRQKEQLLQEHGLTSDYLKPVYHCPDCKDTGYVNGRRCHCFEQAAINLVYTQSNLKEILERENFSTFSFDYFLRMTSIRQPDARPLRQQRMPSQNATILSIISTARSPIFTSTEIPASARPFCPTVLPRSC